MVNHFPDKISKRALIIFALSSLFFFYDFVGQVYPSVISQDLMYDFSANATQLGAMASCFYYTYAFMQLPAAMLIDRFGARSVLTIVIVLCAISFLWFSLSVTLSMASMARLMMGTTAGFAFVGTLYLVTRWFPPRYFALFAGIAAAMGSFGAILVNRPLVMAVANFGWRRGILFISILGFILAFLIFLVVRDKSPQFTIKKYHFKGSLRKRLKMVFKNSQTWFIGLCSFMAWAPMLAFAALWGVPFLEISCHLNTIKAAEAISFVWLGVAIGSPFLGWLSDMIERRCLLISFGAFLGLISILLLIFIPNIPFVLLSILLFFFGITGGLPIMSFALVKDNNPPMASGIANGFNNMICVMAGIVFQPLIGRFLDLNWHGEMSYGVRIYDIHSYREAFLILPFCYLVALIVSIFFIKETYCRHVYEVSQLAEIKVKLGKVGG